MAAFAFLRAHGARLEREDTADRSVVAYILPVATFEVEYDWREQSVFLLACRTVDGGRPGGYYMHEGQRARLHLAQALDDVDLLDAALRARLGRAQRRSGAAAMNDQLETFAATLADLLDALLERYERVFPTAR